TLNNLILSRIDRMEERLRLLLQKASVIGNSFLQSILEAIEKRLGNDEPIQPELSELINLDWFIKEKELEESDAQYIFKHILACDVAYQTILNYNKKILHKLIAEFVEERFKDNKEYYVFLANHYEKAEVTEKTIEYLEKAGDYAKENYQNGLAIAFYDKLLKISDSQLVISDSKLIDIILKKCNVLQLIGKWNDAEMGFKKALSLSEKLKDKKKIGTSIGSLGWQLYLKSEYEKAMECYENQLKIAKELGDKNVISMIIGHMGVIYWEKGNYNKSMECYKKQLKISEKFRDKSGISIALGHIGLIYWERGEYEEAMKYYEKELNMSRELGNKKGISIATGNMGNIYAKKGNYNKAMECYKKSLKIFEELGDKSGTSTAVGNMGIVYKIEGDYNKAMKCYEKQLKICKELEDKSGISYTFSNIGSVYRAKGDYGRAIDYHKNDLKICEELKDKRGISYAVSNLGNAYKDKGDPQKALECYERSLKIADELGDKKRISIAVENMGIVYSEKGDYDKAMQCYDKAIFIGKELGIKIVLSEYLIDKAELLFLLKKFDESKIINEEGFQIAQEVKEKNNIFRAKVLSAKIDFALAKDDTSQNNAISKLQEMLSKTEDDEEKATLNYELGIMNEELKKEDISKKYKGEALRLYKELYKKTPKFEYKKRIEELK
ncbi:MAG: tetratricopeptide repeat protein, partial [Candidatus Cloacimonetes bacterium]|nr:tetratricopeptide repeat protein [Candidatus Cloacimonadota bacterium]